MDQIIKVAWDLNESSENRYKLVYEIAELAKVYIRDTIPQYQGYVIDFPKIEITLPKEDIHKRFTMKIYIEVNSVFGMFSRTTYI